MTTYLTELIAEQRGAELRHEAHTARLAAVARRRVPGALRRAARSGVELVRPRLAVRRDRPVAVCCTA
jgi:hypothetical protein